MFPSDLVPSVKEGCVDHDINMSPMVRADDELLRVSLPVSLLSRDPLDDCALSAHSSGRLHREPRWVREDVANISWFLWLLKDFVCHPQCLVGPLLCKLLSDRPSRSSYSPRKPWISTHS